MNKSKKKILIISPFFSPEPISTGKFNTDMAVALRDKGHIVKVLCFHPFYPKWKTSKSNKTINGITIVRGGKNIFYTQKTFLRRMILELSFAFFIVRKSSKLQKEIDLIIPVFPPSFAFYCIRFFLKKRIRKVGIVHDLQEIYSQKKKDFLFKIIGSLIHLIEKKVYQSCDKLIFLSNEMKEFAEEKYQLNQSKLSIQYPFVTLDLDKTTLTNDLEKVLPRNKKHIIYSGALGEKQNSQEVYNLFHFCSKEYTNVTFHFFSQGQFFEKLKKENTTINIQFHNLVAKENLKELYQRSTIQIIPQAKETSKGSLPSKLPNLLASDCNILCITDKGSEIDKLFKKYNLKSVVTTWDFETIKKEIKELLKVKNLSKIKQKEISKSLFNINSMINAILDEQL